MATQAPLQLLISLGGGAYTHGLQTATSGQTVNMEVASTSGLSSIRYEVYDYPPGFSAPAGWSTDSSGVIYFAPSNITTTPPAFNVPTSSQSLFGFFMCRVRGNNNPLRLNADGSPNTTYNSNLTDEASCFTLHSPSGQPGVGFNLTNQADILRQWVGPLMQSLRALEGAGAGWKTAIDFDWTQGTSTSFSTDGSQSFGGLTFTKFNSANEATHASAGGGTGLALAPSGASAREWVYNSRTSPGMFLPMSGVTALASVITPRTPLRFYVQTTTLSTQSADSYSDGLAIALTHSAELTSSSGLRNAYAGYLGFSSGNAGLAFDTYISYGTVNQGGITNEPGHKPTFDPTTVIVEAPFGIIGGIVNMYGIWNNATVVPWPTFSSFSPASCAYATNTTQGQLTERGWNGATNTLSGSNPGDWGLALALQNNSGQSNTATISRMRVDYFSGM